MGRDLLSESMAATADLERLGLVKCRGTREWWTEHAAWSPLEGGFRVLFWGPDRKVHKLTAGAVRCERHLVANSDGSFKGQDVLLLDPVPHAS